MYQSLLDNKPPVKKTYVASKNPLVQSVVVQPRSVRMIKKFEEFLQENVNWVKSTLSKSNDSRTFVEESCAFLRMVPLTDTGDENYILALKVTTEGCQVNFYEHIRDTEDDKAHFEICNIVYFGKDELHLATEHFMHRWRAMDPSKTCI